MNDKLVTDLVWNPRVHVNSAHRKRGALVGTLLGVPVDGRSIGRGVAYQFAMVTGEVHTVWWDGTVGDDGGVKYPYLYDVDTDQRYLRNPEMMLWFARLEDVEANPDAYPVGNI